MFWPSLPLRQEFDVGELEDTTTEQEEKKSRKNIFPTSGDSLGDKFYFTPYSFIVTSIPILCSVFSSIFLMTVKL
jgi:hypothetical protein